MFIPYRQHFGASRGACMGICLCAALRGLHEGNHKVPPAARFDLSRQEQLGEKVRKGALVGEQLGAGVVPHGH